MKCVVVKPGKAATLGVMEMPNPVPKGDEVLVEMIEVGICGTDVEINGGLYGEAPANEEHLIIGHEGLGRLPSGELVVPMVRQPCPDCVNCREGFADMCATGRFKERGIKGLHGMLREFIAEDPAYLIRIPGHARAYAVLAEPMSVVAKGLRQALWIQRRVGFETKRALVLGAGPIGLLATLALRTLDWDVTTLARKPAASPKAAIALAAGARYLSTAEVPVSEAAEGGAGFDLIFEATGSAEAAFDCANALAVNGVLCLTSVTAGATVKAVPIDRFNRELVLGNRIVFGTVNAHRRDFIDGLARLEAIESRFKGLLSRFITGRVTFDSAQSIFAAQGIGIKTVFDIR